MSSSLSLRPKRSGVEVANRSSGAAPKVIRRWVCPYEASRRCPPAGIAAMTFGTSSFARCRSLSRIAARVKSACCWFGSTTNVRSLSAPSSPLTAPAVPAPSTWIAMTAVTPMMRPSTVSRLRTRFAPSTAIASAKYCPRFMISRRVRRSCAESRDRVHARGADRRVRAEHAADDHREADRDRHDQQPRNRRGADDRLDGRVPAERAEEPDRHPDPAADQREQDRSAQKLERDVAALRADRLAQPDLAGALG